MLELLHQLQTATINILNKGEPTFTIDEVSGKWANCYKVELADFTKNKKPFWTGYVECNLIADIMNGELNEDDFIK